MATIDSQLKEYLDQLNIYHCDLSSCLMLSAYLLDCASEKGQEEWHQSGSWLMRDMLKRLIEDLPFPPMEFREMCGAVQDQRTV